MQVEDRFVHYVTKVFFILKYDVYMFIYVCAIADQWALCATLVVILQLLKIF